MAAIFNAILKYSWRSFYEKASKTFPKAQKAEKFSYRSKFNFAQVLQLPEPDTNVEFEKKNISADNSSSMSEWKSDEICLYSLWVFHYCFSLNAEHVILLTISSSRHQHANFNSILTLYSLLPKNSIKLSNVFALLHVERENSCVGVNRFVTVSLHLNLFRNQNDRYELLPSSL